MSVNFNLISNVFTDEEHNTLITGVKGIESLIPFAVTLPKEEKQALAGVGLKRLDFSVKTYEYVVKNPEMKPGFMDMAEYGKDITLSQQLQALLDHLVPLVDKIKDTYALVSSEAYSASRAAYHNFKNAAQMNVPGASAIADELGKLFKRITGEEEENQEDQADENPPATAENV